MYYNAATGVKQNRGLFSTTAILVLLGLFALIGAYTAINFIAPAFAKTASQKSAIDESVKSEKPDANSDQLYIPSAAIWVATSEKLTSRSVLRRGNSFSAPRLNVGLTPMETVQSSPLYHLGDVGIGDHIYVDQSGERFVYEIADVKNNVNTANLQASGDNIVIYNYDLDKPDVAMTAIVAQKIGTVVWTDGAAKIEKN